MIFAISFAVDSECDSVMMTPSISPQPFDTSIIGDSDECNIPDPDLQADINRLLETDTEKQKKSSALFILKMKEVRRLSQTAVDDIIDRSQQILSDTVQRLKAGVRQTLAEH